MRKESVNFPHIALRYKSFYAKNLIIVNAKSALKTILQWFAEEHNILSVRNSRMLA